ARGLREMADRLFVRARDHPVRGGVRPGQHLRQGAQRGEEPLARPAMRTGLSTAHSVVEPTPVAKWLAMAVVILYAFVTLVPLGWILLTSIKSPPDSISYPPKVVFEPSLEGYCNLFTTRSRQTEEYIKSLPPAADLCDSLARRNSMVVVSRSNYLPRFINSLIIASGSTLLSVGLGVMAAYAFSRFRVPGKDDLMFFILSTRMMPPIAV